MQLVHRVDSQHHLCQVKLSHVLRQAVLELAEQSQQITTNIVVHHQVLQRKRRKKKQTEKDDVRHQNLSETHH